MKKRTPFNNRLRVLRAEYRVSQQDVADVLEDYSAGYVSLLERDLATPSPTVLKKLSKFFGCEPTDIFPAQAA